jgi:glyoxylase-like metal-dependent hydrolase (beta-lactamase superfamily II)
MKVGDIEIRPVIDGQIVSRLPFTKPLPAPDSAAWQEQHGMFRPDGMIASTVGGFLVSVADRLALVDAGAGQEFADGYSPPAIDLDDATDPFVQMIYARRASHDLVRQFFDDLSRIQLDQGHLPASLEALGIRPDEITDVVLTHLHFDHIGWASAGGAPFFPNATIRCASADIEYFLSRPPEEVMTSRVYKAPVVPERLGPVMDRIETWDSDCVLMPGIDVRLAPGHTPGSSVVVVSDQGQRAMLLGDIVHCPLELTDDEFNLFGDYDQELANRIRQAYAREVEGTDIAVAATHFPGLRFGRVLPGKATRHWTFDVD